MIEISATVEFSRSYTYESIASENRGIIYRHYHIKAQTIQEIEITAEDIKGWLNEHVHAKLSPWHSLTKDFRHDFKEADTWEMNFYIPPEPET